MTDIFTEPTPTPTLEDFMGEGKKYSDGNAVAKALSEKDAFIARLLEEKRQLEADHRASLNTQAFNDRIRALEAAQVERVEPTPPPTALPASTPSIDEATVQRLIDERERQNQRTRNLMQVKDKLTETFGDDYPNRVKARAKELGLSMDRVNEMAAETPTAFYAMLGLDRPAVSPDNVAPPATRQNSAAAFAPNAGVKGNSYYSNLRKTNPKEYWSPRVQMEEYNELKRQGAEKFYAS